MWETGIVPILTDSVRYAMFDIRVIFLSTTHYEWRSITKKVR